MPKSTTSTILLIVVTGFAIFVIPLGALTSRIDKVTQEKWEAIIEESLIEATSTAVLTGEWYQNLENRLSATGVIPEIELRVYMIVENTGMKTAQSNYKKIGENGYVIFYDTQLLPMMGIKVDDNIQTSANGTVVLTEGSIISISAKNASSTSAQSQQSAFFNISNSDEYVISVSDSKMVTVNGTDK